MNRIINFGLLILTLILLSCSTNVKLEDYLDMSAPFNLNINTTNSETGLTDSNSKTLEVNSEKWKKLIDWGKNNKYENWLTKVKN